MKATHEDRPKIDYLDVPSARVYYEVRGNGPTLLLMPGGPADATVFERIAPLLAEWYTVVTYDPRGLSHSQLSAPPDDRTLFGTMADDASHLLAVVGREPMFVFANSGGALIAFQLITRHPGQVHTLVAHEAPTGSLLPAGERDQSDVAMQEVHDTYLTSGAGPAMRKFIAAISEGDRPEGDRTGGSSQLSPEQEAGLDRVQNNLEFFLGHYWNAGSELDLSALKSSPTRIVVAVGEASEGRFPYKSAMELAKRLGTEAVLFPGEHGGFLTHPAEFADRLHRTLAGT